MILGCLVGVDDGFVVGTTVGVVRGDVVGLLPSSSDADDEDSEEDDESSPNADVGCRLTLGYAAPTGVGFAAGNIAPINESE